MLTRSQAALSWRWQAQLFALLIQTRVLERHSIEIEQEWKCVFKI
ncbi:hypothetical protein HBJ16_004862 [Pseudomonas sp. CES]|nr:hypothetical protein HBJ16_004862 [Pseudomonas sp. CES]